MRIAIMTAVAALALAFVASGCTDFFDGPGSSAPEPSTPSSPTTVDQKFAGSTFTINAEDAPGVSMSIQRMVAKGPVGVAFVDSLLVFKTHKKNALEAAVGQPLDSRCTAEYPYATDLVSATWVQVYKDGSAFTGAVPQEDMKKFALCTNGLAFTLKMEGKILSGAGPRFENVTGGTWKASGTIEDYRMRGKFTADFEYAP